MEGTCFEYRGFMLDVSRHFMPVGEIRAFLRAAAVLNLNRFHWHLTDDQGWRIEIRKYPLLTEKGAVRGESFFGGTPGNRRNSGFYTQEEIREVVSFAGSLGIEVVPEIEMPGHAAALLAAYPHLGCRRGEDGRWAERVETCGGIFSALVCGGSEAVAAFLRDVLDEVAELFPFPAVHIGGDEAIKYRWRRCPDCQARIRELGLASEDELQRHLVLETGAYLAKKGKRTIVWNDVLDGGNLPPHFIVQQWRGNEEKTRSFMESGGSVIRSDTEYCYMDYPYGAIDIRRIWEMPRIPDYARGLGGQLAGMECPLWTEYVADSERAAYQLFPRLAAMGLRMSGEAEGLGWEEFRKRVAGLEKQLEAETGLHGAPEEYWCMGRKEAEADREAHRLKKCAMDGLPMIRKQRELLAADRAERMQGKTSPDIDTEPQQ